MPIPDYSKLFEMDLEIPTSYGIANLKRHNIGELIVPTGNIVACDPDVSPETPAFTLQLAPGRYPLILNVATFDADQRVAYAALKIAEGKLHHWEMALLPSLKRNSFSSEDEYRDPAEYVLQKKGRIIQSALLIRFRRFSQLGSGLKPPGISKPIPVGGRPL
jgi:hypothetical protein